MSASVTPAILAQWMAPFQPLFTRPTWQNLLVLVAGAILAPGRRTVTSALSIMGLRQMTTFTNFHRVLNRNRWSSRATARCLLNLLVTAFAPNGPVVIGVDETIERRWGAKIRARGIYRDPVRSSHGHFVKASGLRWISLMLLAPIPWAGLGAPLPDRVGTLLAFRPRARQPPQEADRLGPSAPSADGALVAGPAPRGGRGHELCGHRVAGGPVPPSDPRHPASSRCSPVRPTAATQARPAGSSTGLRRPAAEPDAAVALS